MCVRGARARRSRCKLAPELQLRPQPGSDGGAGACWTSVWSPSTAAAHGGDFAGALAGVSCAVLWSNAGCTGSLAGPLGRFLAGSVRTRPAGCEDDLPGATRSARLRNRTAVAWRLHLPEHWGASRWGPLGSPAGTRGRAPKRGGVGAPEHRLLAYLGVRAQGGRQRGSGGTRAGRGRAQRHPPAIHEPSCIPRRSARPPGGLCVRVQVEEGGDPPLKGEGEAERGRGGAAQRGRGGAAQRGRMS